MSDDIPTNIIAARLDRYAANGLADEAEDHKDDLRKARIQFCFALEALQYAGVPSADIDDIARAVHDAISRRDAQLEKDLSAARRWGDPISLADLDAFIVERKS